MSRNRPAITLALHVTLLAALGGYFAFAAVQGNFGLFHRVQIEAENAELRDRRDALRTDLARLENRTRRLSDEWLDLELLDQQARDVLGLMRPDEIVIR